MYYFEFSGGQVLKYEVVADYEELKKLKEEIIYNCGHIKHIEEDTDYPELFKCKYYKNYSENIVGKKEYFEETRDIYHIAYDKILEPELALKIDDFLRGNLDLLSYMDSIKCLTTGIGFLEFQVANIKKIVEEASCREVDTECLIRLIRGLKELENEINLNKDKKPEYDYVDKIKKLITIRLVATMPLEDYINARKFLSTMGDNQVLARIRKN